MPDEDIYSLLADYKQVTIAKAGRILDVDLPRKRVSVQLADGTHALIGAPDSFFAAGSNAQPGDFYVVGASGVPTHVHESLLESVLTKVSGVLTSEDTTQAALTPAVEADLTVSQLTGSGDPAAGSVS